MHTALQFICGVSTIPSAGHMDVIAIALIGFLFIDSAYYIGMAHKEERFSQTKSSQVMSKV